MFVSKMFFFVHKKGVLKKNDVVVLPLPIVHDPVSLKISDEFKSRILSNIRDDEVGSICRNDEFLLIIGTKLFSKLKMKKEKLTSVNRSVRCDMRLLAKLYLTFKQIEGVSQEKDNCLDMFSRQNFEELCEAFDQVTYTEEKKMKPGLRQNLFYIVKKAGKILQAYSFMKCGEMLSKEIEKFLICFNGSEDELVSGARYVFCSLYSMWFYITYVKKLKRQIPGMVYNMKLIRVNNS